MLRKVVYYRVQFELNPRVPENRKIALTIWLQGRQSGLLLPPTFTYAEFACLAPLLQNPYLYYDEGYKRFVVDTKQSVHGITRELASNDFSLENLEDEV